MTDAIEFAFITGKDTITTEDLIRAVKETKSISSTLKGKIEQIRQAISQMDIKPASNPNNKPAAQFESKDEESAEKVTKPKRHRFINFV